MGRNSGTSSGDAIQSSMGQNGVILLTAGNTVEGFFKAIIPIDDCTFEILDSDLTYNNHTTLATPANIGTLAAGGVGLYADISRVRLATGKAYVYK